MPDRFNSHTFLCLVSLVYQSKQPIKDENERTIPLVIYWKQYYLSRPFYSDEQVIIRIRIVLEIFKQRKISY